MLILTRKPDQTIIIGENITIAVLGIVRNEVKLGFQAPDDKDIFREEIDPVDRVHRPHKKTGGILVLTRMAQGKGVFIDNNTYLRVLGVDRNRVKLGFEAPDGVKIRRGELIDDGRPHRSKEAF